jgi:hypothetical protein
MLNVALIGKLTSHASAKKPGIGAPYTDLTVMTITPTEAGFNKPLVETHAIRAYNLLGDDVAGLDKGDMIHIEGTIESWQRQEIRAANGDLPRHMVQVDGYRVIAEHIRVIQFADGTPPAFTRATVAASALKVQLQAKGAARPVFIPKVAAAPAKPWTVTKDFKVIFSGTVTEARKAFDDKTKKLRRGSYKLLSPEGILIDHAQAICMTTAL